MFINIKLPIEFSNHCIEFLRTIMDDLFLSKRIWCDNEFVAGGILVTPEGKIRTIFRSQQEVNSWMYSNEANEVRA